MALVGGYYKHTCLPVRSQIAQKISCHNDYMCLRGQGLVRGYFSLTTTL